MTDQGLPLEGVTIIELGHSVAAPFAGLILADLGAQVIKVEKEDGDDARRWAPPYVAGKSSTFQALNRNKQSIVVNLSKAEEIARLKKLIVERADVVLQNLRPGAAKRYGLDGDALMEARPDLIYCSIGAFGARGPLRQKPGYDPLMQAFAGLMSVTGQPNQEPVRVGTSIIDMAAGMWSVIGVLAALYRRGSTKTGSLIETSLFETALSWMSYHAAGYLGSGEEPGRHGSGTAMIVPYRGYGTADGFLVIAAGNDKLFASLCGVLGHPEWATDPRFESNSERVRNQTALYSAIEELVARRPTAEWVQLLDSAGIPNAPMQNVGQVLAHAQTKALGIVQESPDGAMSLLGLPLSFDGERPPFRFPPPDLGEHTEPILNAFESEKRA